MRNVCLITTAATTSEDSKQMQISVILAHPSAKSFSHAIAQAVVDELTSNGFQVIFHDLYAEQFDPILPADELFEGACLPGEIEAHCREISHAEGIVIVHPNWWGQPPAVLKGWVDRVIRPGVAYQFLPGDQGEGIPAGLLKAKVALVFNTSNTPAAREAIAFGDPLETLWKRCILGFCGIQVIYREMFSVVVTSTSEQRLEWLRKVREVVRQHFPAEKHA
jgi:NAD(P)H dehydrogenase (quinone)